MNSFNDDTSITEGVHSHVQMTGINYGNYGNDDDDNWGNSDLRERAHEGGYLEVTAAMIGNSGIGTSAVATATTTSTSTSIVDDEKSLSIDDLRQQVVDDMIGHDMTFVSPFEWKEEHPKKGGGTTVAATNNIKTNNKSTTKTNNGRDGLKLHVPMVYCDFTASHRPLTSIEDFVRTNCIPFYGNTHTNTSITGCQSSAFVSEARQIVAESCNASITGKASQDVVLFSGNGTTSAVQLLIDCLGLKHYTPVSENNNNTNNDDPHKPLVILGPMEHHSNILPWRELGSSKVLIETVRYDMLRGTIDIQHLTTILERHKDRPSLKMATFAAASNLTGTLVDDCAITALLHRYNTLSFWDYATGASYLDMNMNPTTTPISTTMSTSSTSSTTIDRSLLAKDAIYFSGHKLLGGVGTPGVLIMKKSLISSTNPPERCGGGTVFYVTDDHHRFLSNKVERYEGGTPDILGIWRLGIVFKHKQSLKQQVASIFTRQEQQQQQRKNEDKDGTVDATTSNSKHDQNHDPSPPPRTLMELDIVRARTIQNRLATIPNVVLVDGRSVSAGTPKLPIFSFLISCGNRFLHYNYVCAVLNDLFGIQSRGGCQCAGPYAQLLLGLEGDTNVQVEQHLVRTKDELLRPGVTRLSLPVLGTTKQQEDYVIDAIRWVATHGWKLLPVYRCNHRSGEWRHKSRPGAPLGIHERKWLSHFRTTHNNKNKNRGGGVNNDDESSNIEWSMEVARSNADQMLQMALQDRSSISQAMKMVTDDDDTSSNLRWYVYPKDVAKIIHAAAGNDDESMKFPTETAGTSFVGSLHPIVLKDSTFVDTSIEEKENLPIADVAQTASIPSMVHFKDGEHTGEAPLDEILDGLDSGELSEECLVYLPSNDNWQLATSLVPKTTTTTKDDQEKEPEQDTEPVEVQNTDDEPVRQPSLDDDVDDELPLLEKHGRKKPTRDNTSWGSGKVQAPKVPAQPLDLPESQPPSSSRRRQSKHVKPPPKLMRQVTQAMIQWDMLQDGDKLLLGLSGGKDSLSLLHILLEFQKKLPIKFEIEVCTIDPMTPSFDPSPLIPYVESLGLKYHYIRDEIVDRAANSGKDGQVVSSLCAYCARMKRGNLYACARDNGCNKLVLAQHLDDLAESFFMSVMHNGFLRTMKANYKINAGDLSVIRPLAYCRESLMTDFAKSANLPIINENCPACFEEPKERARVKKLLSKEETLYPQFYDNIKRALMPLMHDDATAILRSYTEEAVAKSRKDTQKKKKKEEERPNETENKKTDTKVTPQNGQKDQTLLLCNASEDDLLAELARRRAERYRLAGAMPSSSSATATEETVDDPTGQVCTLNGGNGSIPCRELME